MNEQQRIIDFFIRQAPDVTVEFAQMVHSERVNTIQYDIWDLHTSDGRWWVISNPTNLYSQEQFPNMDLALTFHIGLSIRIPRGEQSDIDSLSVEPLLAAWRALDDASEAIRQVNEVEDCQTIGVRCREILLTMVHEAQRALPAEGSSEAPKKSDFGAWAERIADTVYPGSSHRERRQLMKAAASNSWDFANWLTHAKSATLSDAETAFRVTEFVLSLYTDAMTRFLRGVPSHCPRCGSLSLSPERARDPDNEDQIFERPACRRCDWRGERKLIAEVPVAESGEPTGKCHFMEVPLKRRKRPWAPDA